MDNMLITEGVVASPTVAGKFLPGSRPGRDPIGDVALIENHDEAYHVWRDRGVEEMVPVHIDAHHDMYGSWTPSSDKGITIANYVLPALESGIVSEVFWLVPDKSWASAKDRQDTEQIVEKIVTKNGGSSSDLQVNERQIRAVVLGKPLTVCTLDNLPEIDGETLLDIDVDFFIIPNISYNGIVNYGELPWCWPADLISRLSATKLRTDLVTIAYSVEGVYTPLQWKYLGDEVAQRLQQINGSEVGIIQGAKEMRRAALAAQSRDYDAAEQHYRAANQLWPASAAPLLHLAHLSVVMGRPANGKQLYQQAVALDPSYQTPYNSAGFWYFSNGRYAAAERAHRRTLLLNAESAYAYLGLGWIAARKKRWGEAEDLLRKALARNGQSIDANRVSGVVLSKMGRREEAIQAFNQTLKLALRGYKSVLDGLIITAPKEAFQSDPYHGRVHIFLAHLHAQAGDLAAAINGYRMGIAMGKDSVSVRSRLALLCLRQHKWGASARESWQAIAKIPGSLKEFGERLFHYLRWKLRKGRWRLWARRKTEAPVSIWQ